MSWESRILVFGFSWCCQTGSPSWLTLVFLSTPPLTHPQGGLPSLMVRVLCYNKWCHGYKTSNHHRDIKGTVFGAPKMIWLQIQFLSVLNNFKPCSKAWYFLRSAEPNEPSEDSPHSPVVHLSCKLYWNCLEGWHRYTEDFSRENGCRGSVWLVV